MSERERIRVHVLGRFRILTGDTPITIPPRSRKPQEVLQALIAFGGTEVSAGVLIDALWPDSEGDAAYHALETALYRLRQLLGARDAVRMEGGAVSLNRAQLWVDMGGFQKELQRPRRWEDAANLYRCGIELDSLNEGLYRGLMLCHQEIGDHSEALLAYRRCHELLARFLGIAPSAKTQALYHSVRERAAYATVRSEL